MATPIRNFLFEMSCNIGREWKKIGIKLGHPLARLEQFDMNHPRDIQSAIEQMLHTWWKQKREKHTLEECLQNLKEVLEASERRDLSHMCDTFDLKEEAEPVDMDNLDLPSSDLSLWRLKTPPSVLVPVYGDNNRRLRRASIREGTTSSQGGISEKVDYGLEEFADKLMFTTPKGIKVLIYQGDITEQHTTAIVHAANRDLWLGGGTAKAISKVAGVQMEEYCDQYVAKYGPVKVGEVACTRACGGLKCQYVIHALGPINEEHPYESRRLELLKSAILNSILCLGQILKSTFHGSISIPAISTSTLIGIDGVDIALVSRAFQDAIFEYDHDIGIKKPHCFVKEIHLVNADPGTTNTLKRYFRKEIPQYILRIGALPVKGENSRSSLSSDREAKSIQSMPCLGKKNSPTSSHNERKKTITGYQPQGNYLWTTDKSSLSGYQLYGTIRIHFDFPCGKQTEQHPHPGHGYRSTSMYAYLPDSDEGRDIEQLLSRAFKEGLLFTVGQTPFTDADDSVIWKDISLKTQMHGSKYGYPDPKYLNKVREELRSKGIISKEGDKKYAKQYT